MAYDLADDGSASNRRVLADFGDDLGPDGMTIDTEGSIYLAVPSTENPGIYIYSPDGQAGRDHSDGKRAVERRVWPRLVQPHTVYYRL